MITSVKMFITLIRLPHKHYQTLKGQQTSVQLENCYVEGEEELSKAKRGAHLVEKIIIEKNDNLSAVEKVVQDVGKVEHWIRVREYVRKDNGHKGPKVGKFSDVIKETVAVKEELSAN